MGWKFKNVDQMKQQTVLVNS